MSDSWSIVAFRLAETLWLVTVSVWDHLHRRVPNWIVLPVMAGALGYRIYGAFVGQADALLFAAVSWVAVFLLWRAHIFGGGDSKFLMSLFALFPSLRFLVFFSVGYLLLSIPLLVAKYVRKKPRELLTSVRARTQSGQLLPDAEELAREGRPYCWTMAIPSLVYLWLAA